MKDPSRTNIAIALSGLVIWLGLSIVGYGHWRFCSLRNFTPELYVKFYSLRVPFAGKFDYWEFVDQHGRVRGRRFQQIDSPHHSLPVAGQTANGKLMVIDYRVPKGWVTFLNRETLDVHSRFPIDEMVQAAMLSRDGKWLLLHSDRLLTLYDLRSFPPLMLVADRMPCDNPIMGPAFVWDEKIIRFDRGRFEPISIPKLDNELVSCMFIDEEVALIVGIGQSDENQSQLDESPARDEAVPSDTEAEDMALSAAEESPPPNYKYYLAWPLEERIQEVPGPVSQATALACDGRRLFDLRSRGNSLIDFVPLNEDGTPANTPAIDLSNQIIYEFMHLYSTHGKATQPICRVLRVEDLKVIATIDRNAQYYQVVVSSLLILACLWCWWCRRTFDDDGQWTLLSSAGCVVMGFGMWSVFEKWLDINSASVVDPWLKGIYYLPGVFCAKWMFESCMPLPRRIAIGWLVYVLSDQASPIGGLRNIHYVVVAILAMAIVYHCWSNRNQLRDTLFKFSIGDILLWTLCVATIKSSLLWRVFHLFPGMFVWETCLIFGATLFFYRRGVVRWCGLGLLCLTWLVSFAAFRAEIANLNVPDFAFDIMTNYPAVAGLACVLIVQRLVFASPTADLSDHVTSPSRSERSSSF